MTDKKELRQRAEALAMNVRELIPEGLREKALTTVLQLSRAEILEPYQTQRIAKDGTIVQISLTSTTLVNEAGQTYAIATTERVRRSEKNRTMEAHNDEQA
jgi:two-component system CheB/CheR fusion protein